MGWTNFHATHYSKNGKIDRKAECDCRINGETEKRKWTVLKSAMRGSTYYAAVEFTDKETGKSEVFAAIYLTKTTMRDHFNFWYKDMDESGGPCECDCPKGILDLLTETDSEYAIEWRARCREKLERKTPGKRLSKLPIGTTIEIDWNGEPIRLTKMQPCYQFKTPWWYNKERGCYMPKRRLSNISFTVI